MISSSYFADRPHDVNYYEDKEGDVYAIENDFLLNLVTQATDNISRLYGKEVLTSMNSTPFVFLRPGTMMPDGHAATMFTEGSHIFINPTFLFLCYETFAYNEKHTIGGVAFVLMHEAFHNILAHYIRGVAYAEDDRKPFAVDMEVNSTIVGLYGDKMAKIIKRLGGILELYPDGTPIFERGSKKAWTVDGGSLIEEYPYYGEPFENYIDTLPHPKNDSRGGGGGGNDLLDDPIVQSGIRDGYNDEKHKYMAAHPGLENILGKDPLASVSPYTKFALRESAPYAPQKMSHDELYEIGKEIGRQMALQDIENALNGNKQKSGGGKGTHIDGIERPKMDTEDGGDQDSDGGDENGDDGDQQGGEQEGGQGGSQQGGSQQGGGQGGGSSKPRKVDPGKYGNSRISSTKDFGRQILDPRNNIVDPATAERLKKDSGYDESDQKKNDRPNPKSSQDADEVEDTLKKLNDARNSTSSAKGRQLGKLAEDIGGRLRSDARGIRDWRELLSKSLHNAMERTEGARINVIDNYYPGYADYDTAKKKSRGHEIALCIDVSASMCGGNVLACITAQVNNIIKTVNVEYLRVILFDGGVTEDETPGNYRMKVRGEFVEPYSIDRKGGSTDYDVLFEELHNLYLDEDSPYYRTPLDVVIIFTDTALVESDTRSDIPEEWELGDVKKTRLIWMAVDNSNYGNEMTAPIGEVISIDRRELDAYMNDEVFESLITEDLDDDDLFGDIESTSYQKDEISDDEVNIEHQENDLVKDKLHDRSRTVLNAEMFRIQFASLFRSCLKAYGFVENDPVIRWNHAYFGSSVDHADISFNDLTFDNAVVTVDQKDDNIPWKTVERAEYQENIFKFAKTVKRNIATFNILMRSLMRYVFEYDSWNSDIIHDEDAELRRYDKLFFIRNVKNLHISNQSLSHNDARTIMECDNAFVDNCRVDVDSEGLPVINTLPASIKGTLAINNLEGFIVRRSKEYNPLNDAEYINAIRSRFPKAPVIIVKGGYGPNSRILTSILNKNDNQFN